MDIINSPSYCQCCFSEGCDKNLCSEYNWMDEKERYGEMLADVFNLKVSNGFICDICVVRLRDTVSFKKLVFETQKCFERYLQTEVQVEVKNESNVDDEPTPDDYYNDKCSNDDFDIPLSEVKKNISKNEKDCHRKNLSKRKTRLDNIDLKRKEVKNNKGEIEIKSKKEDKVTKGTYSRVNTINFIKYSNICPFRCLRNTLECFCCSNTFVDIDHLRKHMASHHKNNQIINKLKQFKKLLKVEVSAILCGICSKSIKRFEDLKTHLELFHKVIFETQSADLIPFRLDTNIYKCQICSEVFKYFHKLNIHMNIHHQNFICEKCGIGFSSLINLNDHIHRHVTKIHKCVDCNIEFTTLYKKEQHNIDVHKKLLRRICPYCPQRFTGHYTKLIHMIKVHNMEKTEFKCNNCEKVFLRKFMLNSHMRKFHMNERKHECKVCGNKFFGKFDLNQHMTSHTGEKRHLCLVCGKSFARKGTLREHIKVHS